MKVLGYEIDKEYINEIRLDENGREKSIRDSVTEDEFCLKDVECKEIFRNREKIIDCNFSEFNDVLCYKSTGTGLQCRRVGEKKSISGKWIESPFYPYDAEDCGR